MPRRHKAGRAMKLDAVIRKDDGIFHFRRPALRATR
jgi:hypothetical protein